MKVLTPGVVALLCRPRPLVLSSVPCGQLPRAAPQVARRLDPAGPHLEQALPRARRARRQGTGPADGPWGRRRRRTRPLRRNP